MEALGYFYFRENILFLALLGNLELLLCTTQTVCCGSRLKHGPVGGCPEIAHGPALAQSAALIRDLAGWSRRVNTAKCRRTCSCLHPTWFLYDSNSALIDNFYTDTNNMNSWGIFRAICNQIFQNYNKFIFLSINFIMIPTIGTNKT